MKDKCHVCGTANNLEQQLCGFWFCFHHVEYALERGASYWLRLYNAIHNL